MGRDANSYSPTHESRKVVEGSERRKLSPSVEKEDHFANGGRLREEGNALK